MNTYNDVWKCTGCGCRLSPVGLYEIVDGKPYCDTCATKKRLEKARLEYGMDKED